MSRVINQEKWGLHIAMCSDVSKTPKPRPLWEILWFLNQREEPRACNYVLTIWAHSSTHPCRPWESDFSEKASSLSHTLSFLFYQFLTRRMPRDAKNCFQEKSRTWISWGWGLRYLPRSNQFASFFMSFSGLFPDHPSSWVMANMVQICPPSGFH